jgi:enediyne biosynthesis protein E4
LLYQNLHNGRFKDISAQAGPGIQTTAVSRGCAFGDLDNDGDIDIVVNNLDAAPSVLRNDGGNRNNWLMIKCIGTRSNRSAIGARVRVVIGDHLQIREVISGCSYYSQNDLRLHFGMGPATKANSIEILWPSGQKESFNGVSANQLIVIQEGKGIISTDRFRRAH